MENEKKCCENCAYFYQHYGWTANSFVKTCCGHCKNRNLSRKDKLNKFPYSKGCEEWEPKEKEIARQQESLKETLSRMAIKINEIKNWLEINQLDL